MNPINQIKKATPLLFMIALVVVCFAFAPEMQAVVRRLTGVTPD